MALRSIFVTIILCSSFVLSACSTQPKNITSEDNDDISPVVEEKDPWDEKIYSDTPLKIGIITDTQIHPSRKDKSQDGPSAERYIKPRYGDAIDAFVAQMKIFQPDVIVVPGDIIEGTNDEDYVGIAGLQLVQKKIEQIGVPIIWAVGNHELRSVTKQQYMNALSIDYLNGSFDFDGYRIIVLDGNFYPDDSDVVPGGERYIRGHVARTGINFLEEHLKTDQQTVVFIHQPPLVEGDIIDRSPEGFLDNGAHIQSLLSQYNAQAAIGGHIEYKRHIVKEDISYYALPGTIKSEAFPGAFYEATFDNDELKMVMYYKDPQKQEYVHDEFNNIPDRSGKLKGGEYE
jgi:UDP-2,3-diacylglucosamine pyrophosphatase LpxH